MFVEQSAPWWPSYLRVLQLGVDSLRLCNYEVFIEETTAFSRPSRSLARSLHLHVGTSSTDMPALARIALPK